MNYAMIHQLQPYPKCRSRKKPVYYSCEDISPMPPGPISYSLALPKTNPFFKSAYSASH